MFCAGYKGSVTQNALCNMHTVVVSINIRSWKEMSLFSQRKKWKSIMKHERSPPPCDIKGPEIDK